MSKSRLLNWNRQWDLSVWNSTESDNICRFGQAWLREARDIGEGRREKVSSNRKKLVATGLLFDFKDGWLTIFSVLLKLCRCQMTGRRVAVGDGIEQLPYPWVGSDASSLCGAQWKNK